MASTDEPERQRLRGLYDGLREKLLDLTKRNRMLNYSLGARSKRHLQIIDEVPEEVYGSLVTDNTSFELTALPDPDDIPKDEKTEEFISALEHAKVSDIEYLTRLKVLESNGRDDDQAITAVERELRGRLRAQLGMSPRPTRAEINRNDHARTFGIEANPELPKKATKKSHSDRKLQTLKFPDELEAVMEKIKDDARLAEQEMGLSTLFLAFGFLEWYESDSSEKKYFAPLLLLPAKLESRKVHGKKIFSLSASAGSVEPNLSLQKYLETKFGRKLPDFELDDEESAGSIEGYLSEVEKTIDGLNRWRVRRWLVLGHFAFGRLAMYADLAPEKWQSHPAENTLIQSVLAGTEEGDAGGLPSVPDDYEIDDPEIEEIAPLLIHDADASQHSALVDVGKRLNLVVQGPPGTGKSQTITNMIANALALGQKILFLSEKQAALDVVKRRLNRAQLGEFCLEIHSDKSSSKQIIASLKQRIDLGFGNGKASKVRPVDQTWLESRNAISGYVNALHAVADDGRTPFDLMWKSIRGRSLHADLIGSFKNIEFPPTLLKNPNGIPGVLGQVEIYANAAQTFNDIHGHPARSPWAELGLKLLPIYEIGALIDALEETKTLAEKILSLAHQNSDLVTKNISELRNIISAAGRLSHAPNRQLLAQVLPLDLDVLERVLPLAEELNNVLKALRGKPDMAVVPFETMARAIAIVEIVGRHDYVKLTPVNLFIDLDRRAAELESFIAAIEGLLPALGILIYDKSFQVQSLAGVAIAIIVTSKLRPEHRAWLGRFRQIDVTLFEVAKERWARLVAAENSWRARCGPQREPWPPAEAIAGAAETLGRGKLGRLVAKVGGSEKAAKKLVNGLHFHPNASPTSKVIAQLASHVRELEEFCGDRRVGDMLGDAWGGLLTPFNDISIGLKVRAFLIDTISGLPACEVLVDRVLGLSSDQLAVFGSHEMAANAFRAQEIALKSAETSSIGAAIAAFGSELVHIRKILKADPDKTLAAIDLPIQDLASIGSLRIHQQELEEALSRSPVAIDAQLLATDDGTLQATQIGIDWIRSVRSFEISPSLCNKLLGHDVTAIRERVYQLGSELAEAVDAYDASIKRLRTLFKVDVPALENLDDLVAKIDAFLSRRSELSDFLGLKAQRKIIEDLGLRAFLDRADAVGLRPGQVTSALPVLLAHRRADQVRRKESALGQASGPVLDARRQMFSNLDKKRIIVDRDTVRALLLPAKPLAGNQVGPKKTWTEMALIKNEMAKQQRYIPIRTLIKRARHSLQALTPCFMMSPLSLAKFLPASNIEFDITIIDEASQMRPEDALGGLLRTKQIVVVGDPKQLPPTDFFNQADGTSGAFDED